MIKNIIGYEGFLTIDQDGVVTSLPRQILFTNRWGHLLYRNTKEKIIKWNITAVGYARVALTLNHKTEHASVHRLVAIHFIPNPENKPQVNHKDGNKLNNNVNNLEWCTAEENQTHAYITGLNIPKSGFDDSQSMQVIQMDIDGNYIKTFGSLGEAQRNGIPRTCVTRVCKGEKESYKNHKYKFA